MAQLQIVTWMALASQQQEIMTSDQIAGSVNTNPVFIRRILGRLHKARLVNVHHTLPNQACPVGRSIQPALKRFYSDAEAAMKQQLAQVTVADVLDETLASFSQGT